MLGRTLLIFLLLSGCWNSKDIQDLAYITALGLDYVNEEYVIYAQVLNFSNVAKSESSEAGKPVPVWVGRGNGSTWSEALISLHKASQNPLYWGQIKAIVCSEEVLKQGVELAYETMNRYREIRYNIYIFATNEPLEKLLVQKAILNMSPIDTLLITPEQSYKLRSYILPKDGFRIISEINEPGASTRFPSIVINKNLWYEDEQKKPMLQINGAYYYEKNHYIGWLSESDLAGVRWSDRNFGRSPLTIPNKEDPVATLILENPHYKRELRMHDGNPEYTIQLELTGYVHGLIQTTPVEEMKTMAEDAVRKEILTSYKKGFEKKIDVFKLQHMLYLNHPQAFKKLSEDNRFFLTEDSLSKVDVQIKLIHSGRYKNRLE